MTSLYFRQIHASGTHKQRFKINLSEAVGDRKLDQWIFLRCGSYMKKIGANQFGEKIELS